MQISIIDYNSGNLHSVYKAFVKVAFKISPNLKVKIVSSVGEVKLADILILPGVGSFADCKQGLQNIAGMLEEILHHINSEKPFFGICVGMQLLAKHGFEKQEDSPTKGLGVFDADVISLKKISKEQDLITPHMGWNNLNKNPQNSYQDLLEGIENEEDFYFVHSYFMRFEDDISPKTLAYAEYGGVKIPAILADKNIVATQFHPEKSGQAGLKLIENFLQKAIKRV